MSEGFDKLAGGVGKAVETVPDVKYIEFLISKDQSVKICLGIGDDPVYEPYTGGQPSPSLDYPQEIKSVVNPTVNPYFLCERRRTWK